VNTEGLSIQEWVAERREEVDVGIEAPLSLSGLPLPPSHWPQAELSWLLHPFCTAPGSGRCKICAGETFFFQNLLRY